MRFEAAVVEQEVLRNRKRKLRAKRVVMLRGGLVEQRDAWSYRALSARCAMEEHQPRRKSRSFPAVPTSTDEACPRRIRASPWQLGQDVVRFDFQ